ncbi:MAG: antibiotic biosynthesis monooxygenase family protein [Candidatus Eiseniibacteriota bacterium]
MSLPPSAEPIARTPEPPYLAVIFTSVRTPADESGYAAMAAEMDALARRQPGFLGVESARGADRLGITVSYWESEAAIRAWKQVADHLGAQRIGRERWYADYTLRVARIERSYTMSTSPRVGL